MKIFSLRAYLKGIVKEAIDENRKNKVVYLNEEQFSQIYKDGIGFDEFYNFVNYYNSKHTLGLFKFIEQTPAHLIIEKAVKLNDGCEHPEYWKHFNDLYLKQLNKYIEEHKL